MDPYRIMNASNELLSLMEMKFDMLTFEELMGR